MRSGMGMFLNPATCSGNTHDAYQDPECVEQGIGFVFFEHGTVGQQDGISGIDHPDQHERTGRSQPRYQSKAEDAHDDSGHLQLRNIAFDEIVYGLHLFPPTVAPQIHVQAWTVVPSMLDTDVCDA